MKLKKLLLMTAICVSSVLFTYNSAFASFTATKDQINANGKNISDIFSSSESYFINKNGGGFAHTFLIQRVATNEWSYFMIYNKDYSVDVTFQPIYNGSYARLGLLGNMFDGWLGRSVSYYSSGSAESKILSWTAGKVTGSPSAASFPVFLGSPSTITFDTTITDTNGNEFIFANGGNIFNRFSSADAVNLYGWSYVTNSLEFINSAYISTTANKFQSSGTVITEIKDISGGDTGGGSGGENRPSINRPTVGGGGPMVVYDTSVWNSFFDFVVQNMGSAAFIGILILAVIFGIGFVVKLINKLGGGH